MFVLDTIQRFRHYLMKPDQGSYRRMGAKFKVATFLSLLLLIVVFAAIWITCYALITKTSLTNTSLELSFFNFWVILLIFVLFAPLVEEVIFRLPLKYSRNYLLRFVVFLVNAYGSKETKERFEKNVQKIWGTYFWVFFYTMCLIFAFLHIFNYRDYKHLFLWSPLLTSIQLLLGFIVSYLRIRFGFLWGWYFHAIYNLLIISLFMTLIGVHPLPQHRGYYKPADWVSRNADKDLVFEIGKTDFKTYQVDNSKYSISIVEGKEFDGVISGYGVTPSRIFFDRTSAEHILKILSNNQIKVHDPDSLSLTVELKMKTPQKNSNNARNILEREMFKALSIK